jgi:hypothetical protein
MKSILTAFWLLLSIVSFGQYKVTGQISEDNKRVSGATILLLKGADSSLITSTLSTSTGAFTFQNINSGNYLVSVSMIGFQTTITAFELVNNDVQLNTIHLQAASKTLGAVTVTAKKPFLEQRADKLVVNVENSATAAGGTALEVLQNFSIY